MRLQIFTEEIKRKPKKEKCATQTYSNADRHTHAYPDRILCVINVRKKKKTVDMFGKHSIKNLFPKTNTHTHTQSSYIQTVIVTFYCWSSSFICKNMFANSWTGKFICLSITEVVAWPQLFGHKHFRNCIRSLVGWKLWPFSLLTSIRHSDSLKRQYDLFTINITAQPDGQND